MASSSRHQPSRSRRRRWLVCAVVSALLSGAATSSDATVFYARDELFDLAFPDATRIEARDFFLTAEQRSDIERRANCHLESDLVTVYVGVNDNGDGVLGYAIVDTHLVRTLPETFLIVIAPDGTVSATHVVAFYEPLEYLPHDRWLAQLDGWSLASDLRVGRGVAAITGSTLSARAVVGGIRRALAIHDVLIAKRH